MLWRVLVTLLLVWPAVLAAPPRRRHEAQLRQARIAEAAARLSFVASRTPSPRSRGAQPLDISSLYDDADDDDSTLARDDSDLTCRTCSFAAQPPPATTYSVLSERFDLFKNVCVRVGAPWQLLYVVHNDADVVAVNSSHAREQRMFGKTLEVVNTTSVGEAATYDMVGGRTYAFSAEHGNIAHTFQTIACEIAALLSHEHRAAVNITLNRMASMKMTKMTPPLAWAELPLVALASILSKRESIEHFHVEFPRTRFFRQLTPPSSYRCYAQLVAPKYSCGGGHGLRDAAFPADTPAVWREYRRELFELLDLDESRACVRNVLIYGRPEQPFRRIVNADEVAAAFRQASPLLNVTVLPGIPRDPIHQALLFNWADVLVSVHSASMYNAIYTPSSSIVFELGRKSWWINTMAPQFKRAGIHDFEFIGNVRVVDLPPETKKKMHANYAVDLGSADVHVDADIIAHMLNKTLARSLCGAAAAQEHADESDSASSSQADPDVALQLHVLLLSKITTILVGSISAVMILLTVHMLVAMFYGASGDASASNRASIVTYCGEIFWSES